MRFINKIIIIGFITILSGIYKISAGFVRYTALFLFLSLQWGMIYLYRKNIFYFYRNILTKKYASVNWLFMYIVLVIVSFIRVFFSEVTSITFIIFSIILWTTIFHYFIAYFFAQGNFRTVNKKMIYVFYSLQLYVFVNVALYFFGIEANTAVFYPTRTSLLAPLFKHRVFYALSPSLNGFGIVAGLAFSMSFVLFIQTRRSVLIKVFYFFFSSVNFFALISTDSRGAMLTVFISLSLLVFFSKKTVKYYYALVFVAPIIILFFLNISSVYAKFLPFFPSAGGTLVFNGREVIWSEFLVLFKQYDFSLFTGYGYIGQAISNISNHYMFLFSEETRPQRELVSLHNMAFQNIIDIGIIGYFVLFWIVHKSYILVSNSNLFARQNKTMLGVFLLFSLVSGITDLTLNIYNTPVFLTFMMFVIVANSPFIFKSHRGIDCNYLQ